MFIRFAVAGAAERGPLTTAHPSVERVWWGPRSDQVARDEPCTSEPVAAPTRVAESMSETERELIERAIGGDPEAARVLVDRLAPVVQARVARALSRRSWQARGRNVRQEVEDLVQEVFLSLFDRNGKVLQSWEADKGLSFENFVGLVAERQVASILRSGKRCPWKEDPTLAETLDRVDANDASAEAQVASRQQLELLLDRLREELSPRGLHLFYELLVRERPIPEVCAETGLSRDAIYQWRSRLSKLVRQLAADLSPSATTADVRG